MNKLFWIKFILAELDNVLNKFGTHDAPHLEKPTAELKVAVANMNKAIVDGPKEG